MARLLPVIQFGIPGSGLYSLAAILAFFDAWRVSPETRNRELV